MTLESKFTKFEKKVFKKENYLTYTMAMAWNIKAASRQYTHADTQYRHIIRNQRYHNPDYR